MAINEGTRVCTKCRTLRPVSEFYVQNKETGRINPWCKECYRDWYASRGGYRTVRSLTCEWCDRGFESPYARSRFCSSTCKSSAAASRRRGGPTRKPDRECAYCASPLPRSKRADAKFCSAECNERAHRQTRNFRRRAGEEAPLRPRKKPLVNLAAIAKRDRYRCGICGDRVDMTLKHPDPGFASLDHVVPLAQGGADLDPANLRLAHLRCNLSRRDVGGGEQLRLIG